MSVTAPAENAAGTHLNFLDGLRALAALFVLFHHAWLQAWPILQGRFPDGWVRSATGWLLYGNFAVDLFIVLSGFCLMLPVVRRDGALRGGAREFFKRRARRILPPYYFALLLSLLLVWTCIGQKTGSHWDISVPVTGLGLAAHLLLLQDVVAGAEINHALWTIAAECHIYLFFPLFLILWRRFGGVRMAGGAVAMTYFAFLAIASLPLPPAVADKAMQTVGLYSLFVLGMFGASVAYSPEERWTSLRRRLPWSFTAACAGGLVILLCNLWGMRISLERMPYLDTLVGLFALCLLVALARSEANPLRACLSWKPLVVLGGFSYSLYLIHAPLLQVVWQYAVLPWRLADAHEFALLLLVGTPLILGSAYLFYQWCERPFLNTPGRGVPSAPHAAAGRRKVGYQEAEPAG